VAGVLLKGRNWDTSTEGDVVNTYGECSVKRENWEDNICNPRKTKLAQFSEEAQC
jgi:hypothetical protein